MKICTKCGEEKPLSEFNKQEHGKYGLRSICRVCSVKASQKYYRTNVEKERQRGIENNLMRNYGLSLEQYDQLSEQQGNICAICGNTNISGIRLYVDHDHKTDKVRGLLCLGCNAKLGWYEKQQNNIYKYLNGEILPQEVRRK